MKNNSLKSFLNGMLLLLGYILVIPRIAIELFQIFNLDIQNDSVYIMLNLTIYIITIIIIFLIYKKDLIEEAKIFKQNIKENLKIGFKYWIYAFIFMMISNLIIIYITGGIASNEEQNRIVIHSFPVIAFISMIFIGPFIEEILFRKSFKNSFKNEQIYCLFSGFLFGLAHILSSISSPDTLNYLELLFIIPYSGIGYFFAKAYTKTNTIYTSTTFHILHNLIAVSLAMIGG